MYTQFFRLKQEPFSIAPDPHFLYMSERHREALAHLLYGVGGGGGFVLLSGEIGAGKTTVCRCFLEQVPRRCNVAYIFNPKLTVIELLKSVCDEFGITLDHRGPAATVKDYVDPLNAFLLKTHAVGQNNVLVIDEAQNLSADVLEQLRLLTNLETTERKLLQIILIGQPELRTMLARPELEQLAQRVVARFHLEALSVSETAHYIRHRLAVAGMTGVMPFDRDARKRIHELSRGIPRRVNLLCDHALLGAYANNMQRVDRKMVDKAAAEVFGTPTPGATAWWLERRRWGWGLGALAVLSTAAALWFADVLPGWRAAGAVASAVPAPAASDAAASVAASGVAAGLSSGLSSGMASAAVRVPPAVAAPPATPAELQSRLAPLLRDPNEAWRTLAPAWKVALPEGDFCRAAPRQQVQCFDSARTSLALIRQLERPGILTLYDGEDKPFYVLLTGLTAQTATLRGAEGSSHTVAIDLLSRLWRGDFATLWRAPPGSIARIADGNNGVAAEWLVARIDDAAAAGAASQPAAQRREPMKARIHAFQLAHGLQPTGLAGATTFMQINRVLGVDEPRLQAQR